MSVLKLCEINFTPHLHLICPQIYIRSTDYDRTLMSVEANLAGQSSKLPPSLTSLPSTLSTRLQHIYYCLHLGLYPPTHEQVFNPDLKWQPIPVHTVPQSEEKVCIYLSDPR